MIEATLIGYLRNELGVHVSASVPRDRPQRFVTVERTGGALDQFRDLPMFAVQAWGVSAADAASLADDVRKALPGLIEVDEVARVNVGSTYNFPDPDSGQARYQTVCDLVVKVDW